MKAPSRETNPRVSPNHASTKIFSVLNVSFLSLSRGWIFFLPTASFPSLVTVVYARLRPCARLTIHRLRRLEREGRGSSPSKLRSKLCQNRQFSVGFWQDLSNFSRSIVSCSNFPSEVEGIYFWYEDCWRFYASIAMKQPTINPSLDQNWSWPEKTWFQERLNAIKAKEQELRRKPMVVSARSMAGASKPNSDQEPGALELSPKPRS